MASPLAPTFLAALAPPLRARWAAVDGLEDRLIGLVAAGREPPDLIGDDPVGFVAYLAARVPADGEPAAVLSAVRPAELALARACATGDAAALARFEAATFDEVDAAWAAVRSPPVERDELRQAVRTRLFVAGEQPARITGYHGRGPLRAWVRMTATRLLVDELRARAARPVAGGLDALVEHAAGDDDPELAFLKRRYRADFRAAFTEALAALEPRARNLLRHRYLDGLDVGAIAALYGRHRVSMSRTLTRVRDELEAGLRRAFMRRLGVERAELDSLMTLVASRLDVSLRELLATRPD